MSVSVSDYVPNAEEIISFSNHGTYFDEDKVSDIVFDGLLSLYEQVIPSPKISYKSVLLGEKDQIGPIPERGHNALRISESVGIGRFSGEATSVSAKRTQEELRSENEHLNTHMPTRSLYNQKSHTLTSHYLHNKLSIHVFKQGEYHLYVNFRIAPKHSPDKESEREATRIEYRVADVIYQQIFDHFEEQQNAVK